MGIFSGKSINNHYEYYSNITDQVIDPWPGGVQKCKGWEEPVLEGIKPLGWY